MENFFDEYLRYTEETESSRIYHRWCVIAAVGAILGRNIYFPNGHFRDYPNLYCMLIGSPGTRKSTAIKLVKKLIAASGYDTFAAEKTSKEKFLLDLEGVELGDEIEGGKKRSYDSLTEKNLWGENAEFQEPKEVFIVADEWNDFAGQGNLDFYTTLGNLWDWDNEQSAYRQRLKNSRSVSIFQPTVAILGGNTPENFAKAFPAEIIGTGFLSRMLLIHGARRAKRIPFPPEPDKDATEAIINKFKLFRNSNIRGAVACTLEARQLLEAIYLEQQQLPDPRFHSYETRRFTMLKKLCLIIMTICYEGEVTLEVVIFANTILTAAEILMPKALGEFGKSKNSDVTNKIMEMLINSNKPLSFKEIWAKTHNDLNKFNELADLMQGLANANKVQHVQGKGYLPKREVVKEPEYVDFGLLTEEEREML